MAESSQHPLPPPGPGDLAAGAPSHGSATGRAQAPLAALAIAVGGGLLGVVGGLVWAVVAPEALFVVASHGVAYVVNPETSAFIAADGWFSVVAVTGGLLIGLAGYLLGVRRFGPLPVVAVLAGATAAGFLAWWTGRNLGLATFRHRLETSKPGTLLRQPVDLGAHGALAFWPLAAGAVVGGIELVIVLRERRHRIATERTGREPLPFGSGQYPGLGGQAQHPGQAQRPGQAQHPGPGGQAQHGLGGQAQPRQAGWSSDQHDS